MATTNKNQRLASSLQSNNKKQNQSSEVNSFLRNELAHLWPAIANINALQKACAVALPQLFCYCYVLHLEAEKLVLAAPNAALASKLKQQLPQLQIALQKGGWPINAIRIKVQNKQTFVDRPASKQAELSASAVNAFNSLEKSLSNNKHNTDLLEAVRNLLTRRK